MRGSIGPVSRSPAKEEKTLDFDSLVVKKKQSFSNRAAKVSAASLLRLSIPASGELSFSLTSGASPSGLCQEQRKMIDSDELETPRTLRGTKN